ncbi:holin family protein [Paracoccus sp. (in: a-proteobacteria)]|uniref:holin family protein n=1 Tax=Paracoccus sp. TaxID=267 RepID=UPI00272CD579|nr:holin family protein [Paracoccus sp. (in: a-proteobacteria)]
MGVMGRILGVAPTVTALGHAATGMAEIFTQNATRRMELDEEAHARALTQHGQEFLIQRQGRFDAFVNGLNRLPRPLLALGTMGLFIYAMVEPGGFGLRMQGLQMVPEPLWWLLGAIVGFYFGAREAHYLRNRVWPVRQPDPAEPPAGGVPAPDQAVAGRPADDFADNAALRDWAATLRR